MTVGVTIAATGRGHEVFSVDRVKPCTAGLAELEARERDLELARVYPGNLDARDAVLAHDGAISPEARTALSFRGFLRERGESIRRQALCPRCRAHASQVRCFGADGELAWSCNVCGATAE